MKEAKTIAFVSYIILIIVLSFIIYKNFYSQENNISSRKICFDVDILMPDESDEIIFDKNSKIKIEYKKDSSCLVEIIN